MDSMFQKLWEKENDALCWEEAAQGSVMVIIGILMTLIRFRSRNAYIKIQFP